ALAQREELHHARGGQAGREVQREAREARGRSQHARNLPANYDRFMTARRAIASKRKHGAANVRIMVTPIRKQLRKTEVNAFLRSCQSAEGFEFVERVLEYFDCSYSIVAREVERIPAEGSVVLLVHRAPSLLEAAALLKLVRTVRGDVRLAANARLSPY